MTPMQPDEARGIAAQVAASPRRFAGVVVVFRPDSVHRWSRLDRFRLRLLLEFDFPARLRSVWNVAAYDQAPTGIDLAMV
jgi:hypothetical protein